MKIKSKLPDIDTTIFATMSQLAAKHKAINLSQGFPDFDTPAELVALVYKYLKAGHNQYAPLQGVMDLRQAIAKKVQRLYGAEYDPETEITVTTGATEALFCAFSAFVHPGDEVILFEPAYDAYLPAIKLNGGIPVFVKLQFPKYQIDWDAVNRAITPKTRLLVLNFPHNPTGAILTPQDIDALKDIVRHHPLLILSDEAYEHIIFDGHTHLGMSGHPELAQRSIVVCSFAKTYHTTGWKVGYSLAPKPLSRELQRIHQFVTFAVNTPIQYAYAEYLKNSNAFLDLGAFYQKKRDTFLRTLQGSGFKPLPCLGTYFIMLDYSRVSSLSDIDFANQLTIEYGVAAIPPSVFYNENDDHKVLRFCFAKKDDTLKKAAKRLCSV